MTEDRMLQVLGSARDVARAQGFLRLAEHLDDAMLMAASEYHAALEAERAGEGDDAEDASVAGGAVQPWVH
jgi:hypothetical protein